MDSQIPPNSDTNQTSAMAGLVANNAKVEATGDNSPAFAGKDLVFNYLIGKATIQVLLYVITAILGGIIAIVFDLNGKIYEAVGRQSAAHEIFVFETQEFQNQIQNLKIELRYNKCMNDMQVKDKSGCYKL